MKVKYLQKWTDVIYGKTDLGRFRYWYIILGKGDETLKPSKSSMLGFWNWLKKNWKWKKYIILVPKGNPETEFQIGFYCLFPSYKVYSNPVEISKISSVIRKISDGPFAMRMGPEDCFFFVIGDGKITLEIAGYIRNDLWLF